MDPTLAPEPAPQPVTSTRGRKISWVVLCIVLILPLGLVVAFTSVALAGLARQYLSDSDLPSFLSSPQLIALGSFALAVLLAVFLARRGLKRGWNSTKGLYWGWGIFSLLSMVTVTGIIVAGRHVRQSSIEGAVLGNLRGLSAAADQYFLENGVSTVSYDSLVGATNYLKAVNRVRMEIYPAYFTQGITITVTGVAGARTITYAP